MSCSAEILGIEDLKITSYIVSVFSFTASKGSPISFKTSLLFAVNLIGKSSVPS